MVVNKKGIYRVIEVTIAIILLLTIILVVSSRRETKTDIQDFSSILREILDEIAKDNDLRKIIVEYNQDKEEDQNKPIIDSIKKLITLRLPYSNINNKVIICKLVSDQVCKITAYPTDAKGAVYSEARIINSVPGVIQPYPKVLRIYVYKTA